MNQKLNIFILEKQPADAELLAGELQKTGIHFSMKHVATESEFCAALRQSTPDMILADYLLPPSGGMCALVAAQRETPDTPFIFICAAPGEETAVEAIKQGATDYILRSRLDRLGPSVLRALREAGERRNRKIAEQLLKESEVRYRTIVRETGQIVYDLDLSSGVIQWQGAIVEVAGYSWDEMQRIDIRGWEEHIHPDDRALALSLLYQAARRGHRYLMEYRFRRKDDSYIFVKVHGSFLMDSHGKAFRMLGTMSNVTERKTSEDHIREQARLLDLAHDAIVVRGLDDCISYWNESAERLYGWTSKEAVGQKAEELLRQDANHSAEIRQAVLRENEWIGELTHSTKAGREVRVETRLTLVRDQRGNPKSILAIITDITERKKLETQVLRSQRMDSLGTLAGGVAHDLNNILAPIMMAVQMLEISPAERERKKLLNMIRTSTQRGADLVRQVLSFCRDIEGRRIELQVTSLVREVSNIMRETFPKSIRLEIRHGRDLWPVVADPTQLHQVLLNLCVNARDAMPNGGVLTLSVENIMMDPHQTLAVGETKPIPYVVIGIADTGTGIPDEIREKIFDPFFTTKETGQGTGLGLSTSLGIVKSHGGLINVYTEPGKGTAFKVYLPAQSTMTPAVRKAREAQFPRGKGELILFVDDEAAFRAIAQQTLQAFGYRVITAANGAEAVELYARRAPEIDVLLTDMMMPVMDGPAAIHVLHRMNPNLKVIAASGLSPEARMASAPSPAVKAFLPKPYTVETLLTTLHQVLEGDSVV